MHTNATNHTGRPDLAVPIWTIDHVAAALHHWSTRTTTVMVGYSPRVGTVAAPMRSFRSDVMTASRWRAQVMTAVCV